MRTDNAIPGIIIQEENQTGLCTLGLSNGAPSSTATVASKFAIGCILIDTTNGLQYYNAGTVATPSWNSVSEITAAEIGTGAVTNTKLGAASVTTDKLDSSTIQYAEVSLTANQVKALRATPITVVAAQSGKIPEFVSAQLILDYATTAYTITAGGDDFAIRFNNGAGDIVSETIETTGFVDQAADMAQFVPCRSAGQISTGLNASGASLVIHNSGANELTLGDSPIRVKVAYRMHTSGL